MSKKTETVAVTETNNTTNEVQTMNDTAKTETPTPALIVDAEGKPKTGIFTEYEYPFVKIDIVDKGRMLNFLRLDAAALNEEVQRAAMMIGLKNKIIDAAAIARDRVTGKSATLGDKYEAMSAIVARLLGGEWNTTARKAARITADDYLIMAIVEIKGIDEAKARTWVEAKTKDEKTALRKMEAIATKIAEIMARGATNANGEALLGELDAL